MLPTDKAYITEDCTGCDQCVSQAPLCPFDAVHESEPIYVIDENACKPGECQYECNNPQCPVDAIIIPVSASPPAGQD